MAALPTGPSLTGATLWASRRIMKAIPISSATAATRASSSSVVLFELEDDSAATGLGTVVVAGAVTVRTGTDVVGLPAWVLPFWVPFAAAPGAVVAGAPEVVVDAFGAAPCAGAVAVVGAGVAGAGVLAEAVLVGVAAGGAKTAAAETAGSASVAAGSISAARASTINARRDILGAGASVFLLGTVVSMFAWVRMGFCAAMGRSEDTAWVSAWEATLGTGGRSTLGSCGRST